MQSCFHSGYGCVTASLKVLNDDTIALDSKQYCAGIFIDLAKAFDTVDHSILVGRLRSIGVSEGSLAWFANYFSNCINSEHVLPLPTKGVPQGSIQMIVLYSAGPSPDFVLNALQQSFLGVQQAFSALNLVLKPQKHR